MGEAMWADMLAASVLQDAARRRQMRGQLREIKSFMPPSTSSKAKVAVCDHHPLNRHATRELLYA
jgi:hypothetical protein